VKRLVGTIWADVTHLGPEYFITSVAQFSLCVVAMWTSNERYHAVFAISMFAYQISWALRMYDMLDMLG
jgi:hypothetical protein